MSLWPSLSARVFFFVACCGFFLAACVFSRRGRRGAKAAEKRIPGRRIFSHRGHRGHRENSHNILGEQSEKIFNSATSASLQEKNPLRVKTLLRKTKDYATLPKLQRQQPSPSPIVLSSPLLPALHAATVP
jgi:hypothetical protein